MKAKIKEFIEKAKEKNIDIKFTSAFRSSAKQATLNNKNSTIPAKSGTSLHEAGRAVDISWNSLSATEKEIIPKIAEKLNIKWGKKFNDPVHFYMEVPKGRRDRDKYIKKVQEYYNENIK